MFGSGGGFGLSFLQISELERRCAFASKWPIIYIVNYHFDVLIFSDNPSQNLKRIFPTNYLLFKLLSHLVFPLEIFLDFVVS